ncbi:hypothetical protein LOH54_01120 [Sulfurimonas sp. HSL-3221]|uniref:hypothetical protein n=1 Tax=Sulfurimonadaceae TaxID=2771471 RepID=UPI001E3C6527|nr:hypothetical protein [Sulfurimonas sp. HSL-3221]UFS62742.1 hypothetical protein LOH54_01120 [Sulfurimonas sp. HSL-3221]
MKIEELSLNDYKELLGYLSKTQSDSLIDNDSVEHAAILVSELVKSATKEIRLFTTSFCEEFYNRSDVINAFESAAEKKVQFQIISRKPLHENPAYAAYNDLFQERVSVKTLSTGIVIANEDDASERMELNNFMIIDKRGIRYEQGSIETPCNGLKNVNARGTFNRPVDAELFVDAFDKAWSRANFLALHAQTNSSTAQKY